MYPALIDRIFEQVTSNGKKGNLLALPEYLLSLRRLCHQENSDIYDVEQAIAKEFSFAAYILKLANSALYGAGKIPCQNLVSVIRRLGMHSVSQYAMAFALKKRHELSGLPPELSLLLRANWQLSWGLAQEATQIYSQHRLTGNKNAKNIDVSDVLLLAILLHTGRLAVLSDFALSYQDKSSDEKKQLSDTADKLNLKLLPLMFEHWNLPADYCLLFNRTPQLSDPLHAVDYLFAAALLRAYPQNKQEEQPQQYNFLLTAFSLIKIKKIADRLCYLRLLTMDDLKLPD